MARANTILTDYRDEVGRLATVTIDEGTDTGDPNYGPDVLVNDNPAHVAKILTVSGSPASGVGAWQLELPSAMPITLAAILHHNIDPFLGGSPAIGSPALNVRLQANTSSSWTSPPFDEEFIIPAPWAEGTTWQWPIQPWLDLTDLGSPSPPTYQFWRLLVENNSEDLQVGGLKLYSQHLILESDMRDGWTRVQRKPLIRNRTAWAIDTKYSRGTTLWQSEGSVFAPTSRAEELETHWFNVDGSALPSVIVPNGLRNTCQFVERTEDFREVVRYYNEDLDEEWIEIPFTVQALGRGLRPGGPLP